MRYLILCSAECDDGVEWGDTQAICGTCLGDGTQAIESHELKDGDTIVNELEDVVPS